MPSGRTLRHVALATALWLLASTVGCGRIGFATTAGMDGGGDVGPTDASVDALSDGRVPDTGPSDARLPDGALPDSAVIDSGRPDATVGVVTLEAGLSTPGASDRGPALAASLLEVYFSSDRAGGAGADDIWRATRPTLEASWGTPSPVAELNTAESETGPALSGDGRILVFARSDARGADIFFSTRPSVGAAWSAPVSQSAINSGGFDGCPSLSADALTVVFCSERRGGTRDLHTAARTNTSDAFGTVNFLGPVSSSSAESGPFICIPGELRLFFASDRAGGAGGNDLYQSSRAAPTDAWGAPALIPNVNTAANEEDPWVSADGSLLVFSSDRSGDYEIYVTALR